VPVLDALLDARRPRRLAEAFASATSPGMSSPNAARDAQRRLSPAQRKTYNASTSGGSGGDFNSKHPRGRAGSSQGGKFIAAGASGESVRAVQSKVGVKQDGKFGNQTHNAVRDFQRRHGLVVDGVVGHQTALAMSGKFTAARRAQTGALRQSDRSALGRVRAASKAGRKATAPTRARGGVVV
jgi:peptidoglycan hydrolase-like protein with peptidoglycan-binding domain